MGWIISHGTNAPSATAIETLAYHLANVLTGRGWRILAPTFVHRHGDPFTVSATDARRVADMLLRAADHRQMPVGWAGLARQLAEAAHRAAAAGQPWEWR